MAERLPWVSSTPEVIPKALNHPKRRSFEQGMSEAERAKWEKRMAWYRRHPGTPASKAFSNAIGQDK